MCVNEVKFDDHVTQITYTPTNSVSSTSCWTKWLKSHTLWMICLLLVLPISLLWGDSFGWEWERSNHSSSFCEGWSLCDSPVQPAFQWRYNVNYIGHVKWFNSTFKKYKEKGESNFVIIVFIYSKYYSSTPPEVFLRYLTFFFCTKTSMLGIHFTLIIELILHCVYFLCLKGAV